jgi:outer membrane biosynthesis protein TonB
MRRRLGVAKGITSFLPITAILAGGGSVVMRTWYVASAFAVIVTGSTLYAVVGSPVAKVGPKADAPVDKVHLFSAPKDIPHAPATDLIATKVAIQPVIWPELPKVQEKKPAPPQKAQEKKPVPPKKVQEKKPAPPEKKQAKTKPRPKKPVAATG